MLSINDVENQVMVRSWTRQYMQARLEDGHANLCMLVEIIFIITNLRLQKLALQTSQKRNGWPPVKVPCDCGPTRSGMQC